MVEAVTLSADAYRNLLRRIDEFGAAINAQYMDAGVKQDRINDAAGAVDRAVEEVKASATFINWEE